MDSIETKMNQLSTSFQQFYMSVINGEVVKGIIGIGQAFVDTFNQVGPFFSVIVVANLLASIKTLVLYIVASFVDAYKQIAENWQQVEKQKTAITMAEAKKRAEADLNGGYVGKHETGQVNNILGDAGKYSKKNQLIQGVNILLNILPTLGASIFDVDKKTKNLAVGISQVANGFIALFRFSIDPVGAFLQLSSSIIGAVSAFSNLSYTLEELQEQAKEAQAAAASSKKSYDDLTKLANEYEEAVKIYGSSSEEAQVAINDLAEAFPELHALYDAEGNVVNNLTKAYEELLAVKQKEAGQAQIDYLNAQTAVLKRQESEALSDAYMEAGDVPEIIEQDYQAIREGLPNDFNITGISQENTEEYNEAVMNFIDAQKEDLEEIRIGGIDVAKQKLKEWAEENSNIGFEYDKDLAPIGLVNYVEQLYREREVKPQIEETTNAIRDSYNNLYSTMFQNTVVTIESLFNGTADALDQIVGNYDVIGDSSILTQAASRGASRVVADLKAQVEQKGGKFTYQDYVDNRDQIVSAYESVITTVDSGLGARINNLSQGSYNDIIELEDELKQKSETDEDNAKIYSDILASINTDSVISGFKQQVETLQSFYATLGMTVASNGDDIEEAVNQAVGDLSHGAITALTPVLEDLARIVDVGDKEGASEEAKDAAKAAEQMGPLWNRLATMIDNSTLQGTALTEAFSLLSNVDATSSPLEFAQMMQGLDSLGLFGEDGWASMFSEYFQYLSATQDDVDKVISDGLTKLETLDKYLSKAASGSLELKDINELSKLGITSDSFELQDNGLYKIKDGLSSLVDIALQPLNEQIAVLEQSLSEDFDPNVEAQLNQFKEYRDQYSASFINNLRETTLRSLVKAASSDQINIDAELMGTVETLNQDLAKYLKEILDFDFVNNAYTADISQWEQDQINQYFGNLAYYLGQVLNTPIDATALMESWNQQNEETMRSNLSSLLGSIGDDFTISVSSEIYDAFFYGAEGFVQTLDGYDFTEGPIAFLEMLDAAIKAKFGADSLEYQYFQSQKLDLQQAARETERQNAIDQFTNSLPTVGSTVDDYKELIETLRDGTASADEMYEAMEKLGLEQKSFYKTQDGRYGATGLDKMFRTYTSMSDLEKDRAEYLQELVAEQDKVVGQDEERINLLRTQLSLLEDQIDALPQQSGMFNVGNSSDRTYQYGNPYEFASNVADWVNMLDSEQLQIENLQNFLDNAGWSEGGATEIILNALSPNPEAGATLSDRWESFIDEYAVLDIDTGKLVVPFEQLSAEQVDAIRKGSEDAISEFAKDRIAQIDAQIKMLETMKEMEDLQVPMGIDMEVQDSITYKGQKLEGFQDLFDRMRDTITDEQFWIKLTADIDPDIEVGSEKWVALIWKRLHDPEFVSVLQSAGFEVSADFTLKAGEVDADGDDLKNKAKSALQNALAQGKGPINLNVPTNIISNPTMSPVNAATLNSFIQNNLNNLSSTLTPATLNTNVNVNSTQTEQITYTHVSDTASYDKVLEDIKAVTQDTNEIVYTHETDEKSRQSVQDDIQDLDEKNPKVTTSFESDSASKSKVISDVNSIGRLTPKVIVNMSLKSGIFDTLKEQVQNIINKLPHTLTINVTTRQSSSSSSPRPVAAAAEGTSGAKGGPTLVGELGPEMRVSDGEYSIVGTKGAEFVNLKRGDIIFNAEDTAALMRGRSGVRGTAMVSGTGPAMASGIDAAIAALTRERSGWQGLLNNLSSLLSAGGGSSGGGGGGGGGGGSDDTEEYLMELEKWFNWLRRIEKLESDISVIQSKRKNMKDGVEYSRSLYDENALLQRQAEIYEDLANAQIEYRDSLKAKYLQEYGKYFYFIGDAIQINADAILEDTKNNEELADVLQNLMDDYKDVTEQIADNTAAMEDNRAQIDANVQELRDAYIDTENKVLDSLKSMYQNEIDIRQKQLDKRIDSENQYLQALRNTLEQEKQLRDKSNEEEERNKLERKLALLERDTSGASDKEIAQLREQLRQMRSNQYFTQREEDIDETENAINLQMDAAQAEIDILTETNQIKLDNMRLYWEEVYNVMAQGNEAVLGLLMANDEEFTNTSREQQEDYVLQWTQTIDKAYTYAVNTAPNFEDMLGASWQNGLDKINAALNDSDTTLRGRIQSLKEALTSATSETGNTLSDNIQNLKDELSDLLNTYQDTLDTASKMDEKLYQQLDKLETGNTSATGGLDQPSSPPAVESNSGGSSQQTNTNNSGSSGSSKSSNKTSQSAAPTTGTLICKYVCGSTTLDSTSQTYSPSSVNFAAFNKSFSGYTFQGATPTYAQIVAGKTTTITYNYKKNSSSTSSNKKKSSSGGSGSPNPSTGLGLPNKNRNFSYKAYAGGGLVDYTGPAWVDGTKVKPESFLGASDTELLANFLEAAKRLSLGYKLSSNNTISQNKTTNGVTIENVAVTIESGVVDSRADAVDLGKGIADGLMEIARQSSNISVMRR